MGDSGDQGQDTDEFTSDAELDQIARDAEAVQGGRSNIAESSSYDAQFTADNLERQGLPPENFMSAANFAQTRQGGAGGDDTTSTREDFIDSTGISVPSITAASSNLAPGAFEESIVDTPANTMLESALGVTPGIPSPSANVSKQNLLSANNQRLLDLVTAQAQRTRDKKEAEKSDLQKIQEALDASTVAENLNRPIASARSIVGDDFQPALDMVDARTTATGAFDPDAIMEDEEKFGTLPGTTLEDIERLSNVPVGQRKAGLGTDPTFLQGMGVPSFISGFGDFIERTSRDKMAARLAKGDVEEKNIVRNADGLVIGIKDAQGNLIEGIDPDAIMQDTGNGGDQPQRRVAPKAATDPCPEG